MSDLSERFWAKVNKDGPIMRPGLGPCWLWTGATTRGGYGQLKITGSRKNIRTNRLTFFLEHGKFPANKALHHCDNPPCCNPAHIYDGTDSDNSLDALKRKRHLWQRLGTKPTVAFTDKRPFGSAHAHAKLNEKQAAAIKRALASGESVVDLGRRYGVSYQSIQQIRAGKSWVRVVA
jgi:hypothetical protein